MATRTLPSIEETAANVSGDRQRASALRQQEIERAAGIDSKISPTLGAPGGKRATLVNPTGTKVTTEAGSQDAQRLFGLGYKLDTGTPTTTPDAATGTTAATGATPAATTPTNYADAMNQVITAGASKAKDAVYGDLSNNFDNQLLVQRGLIYAALAGERLTPENLRILSPSQQAAVRGASKEALQAEIIGMNSILQGRTDLKDKEKAETRQKTQDALSRLNTLKEYGILDTLTEEQIASLALDSGIPAAAIKELSTESGVPWELGQDANSNIIKYRLDPTTGKYESEVVQLKDDEGGKRLSIAEAAALGVPYGTTEDEAAALGLFVETGDGDTTQGNVTTSEGIFRYTYDDLGNVINSVKLGESPESTEKTKLYATVESGLLSLEKITEELTNESLLKKATGLGADFKPRALVEIGAYKAAEDNLVDVVGRLRSGGAITEDEEKRFLSLLPGRIDSSDTVEYKLGQLQSLLDSYGTRVKPSTSSLSEEERQYIIDNGGDPDDPAFGNVGGDTESAVDITDTLNSFRVNIKGIEPANTVESVALGNKTVTMNSAVANRLAAADAEYFEATGKHIPVSESFRTEQRQQELYRKLSARGARVAPVGSSFHELGLAIDVGDSWKAVKPYLNKYGFINGLPDDMGHFSIGELS